MTYPSSNTNYPLIEVRSFKWPRRLTSVTRASLLGEDQYGRWLGIKRDTPWWTADDSPSGLFEWSFVKLVPNATFWTACFHPVQPAVDVDIVLPVQWSDDALDEVDLELDVVRSADGHVLVRDRDAFERLRIEWSLPDEVVLEAEAACASIQTRIESGDEPFGEVGQTWLARFLADVEAAQQ